MTNREDALADARKIIRQAQDKLFKMWMSYDRDSEVKSALIEADYNIVKASMILEALMTLRQAISENKSKQGSEP